MNYSIIIPVFNKAAFTKRCLDTLQATLAGAGDGEVIVVDNASTDETIELLKAYSWIRLIRNDVNLGFAAANNQGAKVARGKYLVLLNNDTEGFPGWLSAMLETAGEPGVGIVGAKLLFEDRTIQHGGAVVGRAILNRASLTPFHHNYLMPETEPDTNIRTDFQVVTGACLVTPRELYLELGGLDEAYWNGYEDVDYCFKVRERGLRVVYEPKAKLFHFESQSGVQRFRKTMWNVQVLEERWRGKVRFDAVERNFRRGFTRRAYATARGGLTWLVVPLPEITVVVHGAEPAQGRARFEACLRDTVVPVARIVWATQGDAIPVSREIMELRGQRGIAFVHGGAQLNCGWLDELLAQCDGSLTCVASTGAPEPGTGDNIRPVAADARCTLVMMHSLPMHVRLRDFASLDGAVADLTLRCIDLGMGTRGVSRLVGTLPPQPDDASFTARHGISLRGVLADDGDFIEQRLRDASIRERGLVSIVTLSWNAPHFTKTALDSIATYTSEPYEVIVVDNGSRPETIAMLEAVDDPHVRIIYNGKNLGFGGGNNVGIAAALGEHIVVLNNDVVVTREWLDRLIAPFGRVPGIGVTAPRSNRVNGHQQIHDAQYEGMDAAQAFANERSETWESFGYFAERAIGLCLCIDRRVIEEIGGFDERFRFGNFEDDDFCIRVRAAGYKIYICEDSFVHHFGSQSFAANKLDYAAIMSENAKKFAEKWSYTLAELNAGYEPRRAIFQGFDRKK
ncbi:MAG: glycosyltransferase family 2 protein, partial [Candidatus Baltobacteraceae bacterium]